MFRSKNFMKIISLLIAIGLWAYVIAVENPTTTQKFEVTVQLLNVEMLSQRGLTILGSGVYTVDVTVSGKRSDIIRMDKSELIATANMLGYTSVGQSYIPVSVSCPDSLKIVEYKPSKILVAIEELISVYQPVNVTFTGELESGIEPGKITIKPEQIEVKGAKSLVEAVSSVNVDVPISEISVAGNVVTVEPEALDIQGQPVPYVRLSADAVEVSASLFYTKTVPLSLEITGQVGNKYELVSLEYPRTITIRGEKNDVNKVESLTAAAIDISQVIVTSDLPITVELPKNIELARASSDLILKISIKGITTREFEFLPADIAINGLGEGLGAYINTSGVKVKIAGKESVLRDVTKEDLTLSIDLTDFEAGAHVVPLALQFDEELNNVEISPEEVHITINGAI